MVPKWRGSDVRTALCAEFGAFDSPNLATWHYLVSILSICSWLLLGKEWDTSPNLRALHSSRQHVWLWRYSGYGSTFGFGLFVEDYTIKMDREKIGRFSHLGAGDLFAAPMVPLNFYP